MRLLRPTRAAGREHPCQLSRAKQPWTITAAPIRSCTRWGLPCRPCYQGRGALLPRRFALARGTGPLTLADLARAVCFLWHFPWGRPRRRLAGTVFPWSPDFPLPTHHRRQRPSSRLARPHVRRVSRSSQASQRPKSISAAANETAAQDAITVVKDAGLPRRGQCRRVQFHRCARG
jgi:hypothetical protein